MRSTPPRQPLYKGSLSLVQRLPNTSARSPSCSARGPSFATVFPLPPGRLLPRLLPFVALVSLVALAARSPAAETSFAGGLDWKPGPGGSRVARLHVPEGGHTGFTLLTPELSGIYFTNQLSYDRSLTNQNLLNGAGVCAGDFDGDGLVDIYFANLEGRNGLFRNLGHWKFADVTTASGTACEHLTSRGVAFADVNGDGRLDLLVSSLFGPNALLLNEGNGRFRDATAEAGLTLLQMGCESMALGDLNGDGSLDLFIANNGVNSVLRSGGAISLRRVNGQNQVTGRAAQRLKFINGRLYEYGPPNSLYFNDGKGRFTPVSWTDGTFLDETGQPLTVAPRDLGLAVAFRDLNGDGFPDIYACNDFQTPDRVWINDGHGKFRALPDLALRTTCHFSMCVDFADLDRDGFDDFFVSDMLSRSHALRLRQSGAVNPPAEAVGTALDRQQARRNTLQWNRGDGTYADIANFADVDASDWTWSVGFLDVDLDGYEDLLTVNGHAYDTQDLDVGEQALNRVPGAGGIPGKDLRNYPALATSNYLFRNRGDLTFQEVGTSWGFDSTNVSHGLSFADLDNDGDLDVIVSCLWSPPLLYRNETSAPRLAVLLRGLAPNTQGIGARITVRGAMDVVQSQEMQCGGRYLASDQAIRTFAAKSPSTRCTIEVRWRSGRRSLIEQAKANCVYEIDESQASPGQPVPTTSPVPVQFEDVSARLHHRHLDPAFDELQRQPLLARFLSHSGPGVAWCDLDGDGRDELILGAGRGGSLAVFRADGKGGFQPWELAEWNLPAPDDFTGLAAWTPAPHVRGLLAGVSGYETDPGTSVPPVLRFTLEAAAADPAAAAAGGAPQAGRASAGPLLPASENSFPAATGPLAVADVDGDGSLDLFVGGRVRPGQYPAPAASRLYLNHDGNLQADPGAAALLKEAGLVQGAIFSDLNGDGFPELILATEWGPLQIFRNDHGRFSKWDPALLAAEGASGEEAGLPPTLSGLTGWWAGIAVGDFDGDGLLDLVASNWGLNSSWHHPSLRQPARLWYGDLDDNGSVEILEAETDPATGLVAPRRDLGFLSAGWPGLRTRFSSFREFSSAPMTQVLGPLTGKAREVQAVTFSSTVFLQRADRFEVIPLPVTAQLAPAFGVCVGDLDGDGREDLFLSQNFFALRPEEPRLDAGRGLWLRGQGDGRFVAVPGQVSGLKIYGEQRGAALGDLDGDGRVDVAVAQNGGETKLYRNRLAKPGLTVRLRGGLRNPDGIGASLRLQGRGGAGPIRELHAGSGYLSQDSLATILAFPGEGTKLWVRWPGGKSITYDLPPDARDVEATETGTLRVRR